MRRRFVATMVLGLALAWTAAAAAQQTAEERFQAGLYQEEVQGNLQGAIAIYEGILKEYAANRAVAAKAQLHIGICYETLGAKEAQRAYQRVVDAYADQADVVRQARTRLAALTKQPTRAGPTGPVARMLMEDDGGCYVFGMRPSPDGTRLAYPCAGGAVYVRDLASGTSKRVTADGFHMGAVWSPDGMRLAVANVSAKASPLKLIDLRSGAVEKPSTLQGKWFMPHDWSPDGDHLSGTMTHEDQTMSSVVVSIRTGEVTTLSARVNQGGDYSVFSSDGRYVAYTELVDGNQDIYVMVLGTGERRRVTRDAAADEAPLWSPDGETIVYMSAGGLWAVRMVNGRPDGEPRHVRAGRESMLNAWTANGLYYAVSSAFTRSYQVPVDPGSAETVGPPELLHDAMGRLWFAWSPDMQQLASSGWKDQKHIHVARGGSATAFPIGDEIMTSNLWWSGDGREILFTTAARATRDRRTTVFALNTSTGAVRELFPKQTAMHHMHVSADGTRMVFIRGNPSDAFRALVVSDVGNPDGLVLAEGSTPEGRLSGLYGQPLFSPDGTQILFLRQKGMQPDEYLAGLWVVPSDGSEQPRLLAAAPLIQRPVWDPSSRFIVFREIDVAAKTSTVSVVSIETGAKHVLIAPSPGQEDVQPRAWSPDGRWVGFTRTTGGWEYWVTEDPLGQNGRTP